MKLLKKIIIALFGFVIMIFGYAGASSITEPGQSFGIKQTALLILFTILAIGGEVLAHYIFFKKK